MFTLGKGAYARLGHGETWTDELCFILGVMQSDHSLWASLMARVKLCLKRCSQKYI